MATALILSNFYLRHRTENAVVRHLRCDLRCWSLSSGSQCLATMLTVSSIGSSSLLIGSGSGSWQWSGTSHFGKWIAGASRPRYRSLGFSLCGAMRMLYGEITPQIWNGHLLYKVFSLVLSSFLSDE